jgi:putative nucleotidyltransferase with HDIG domain
MALDLGQLSSPENKKLVVTRMQKIINQGEVSFETNDIKKDGTFLPLLINVKKFTWKGKNVFLSTQTDITERKQAEDKLKQSLAGVMNVISQIIEFRDPYTAGHEKRVADLATVIAKELKVSRETTDNIQMAALIHDIGKIAIPAEILSKPTKLTPIEFALIQAHAEKGFEILKDSGLPEIIAKIVRQHHERIDGSGYPRCLEGEEILVEARILTVADVVEAMASHRPYREGLGIDVALAEIEKNRGIIYDSGVADACLKIFKQKEFRFD